MRMSKEEYREFYERAEPSTRRGMPAPENGGSTKQSKHDDLKPVKQIGGGALKGGGEALKKVGSIGGKMLTSAVTSFGKGKFKGITHPDKLIDPKMKELYIPSSNRITPTGHRPTVRELYFGRRKSER